jgi:hypothetical protein
MEVTIAGPMVDLAEHDPGGRLIEKAFEKQEGMRT